MRANRRTMEWAARETDLRGIPRKANIYAVGAFAKVVTAVVNNTTVHNAETLLRLVRSRPPHVPLLTVSNHMSTLDDPLMWGFKGFPITDAKLARWVMPEDYIFGRRPPFPLCNKNIKIIIGEPIEFDLPKMRKTALLESRDDSSPMVGWPKLLPDGLDEADRKCRLYR